MGRREKTGKKRNNLGLSLVELLIAVTILAIIIVPLLHVFVSSANLNLKSKRVMKATMISENIMEEFKDLTLEELILSYGPTESSGVYTFSFDPADFTEDGSDNYQAQVTLDPGTNPITPGIYNTYNQAVVADVNPITMEHSAVYAASPTYDQSVYKIFEERNIAARAIDPTYAICNATFFEEKLNRTITVVISKGSSVLDAQGKTIDQARVEIMVEYTYNDNTTTRALLTTDLKYTNKRELFDNTTTKKALETIFIIYTPRYQACNPALGVAAKEDTIIIRNLNQLETTVSVIRQETDQDSAYLAQYLSQQKAKVTVMESPVWTGSYTIDTPGAISLRSNLITTDPVTNVSTRNFALVYQNASGTNRTTDETAAKIVTLRTAEGKAMDGTAVKNRIYDMTVKVYHESAPTKILASMDGTKIEQ